MMFGNKKWYDKNNLKHADTAHDDHCKEEEDCKYDENDDVESNMMT